MTNEDTSTPRHLTDRSQSNVDSHTEIACLCESLSNSKEATAELEIELAEPLKNVNII